MKVLLLVLVGVFLAQWSVADENLVATILLEPTDSARERQVPLKVYLPETKRAAPVVLFSHGLGGSRDNNAYLGEFWAEHGYVAVFMQHHGSDNLVWKDEAPGKRFDALKGAANLQSTRDRFSDVPFVIDQLERWSVDTDHPLSGRLDMDHLGMSGHSYGASTTQAMMGQQYPLNRSFKDGRIDAVVLFSPSISKMGTPEKSFGKIDMPVLAMTGTKDGSPIDPNQTPESRQEVYRAMPAGNKYHLVFEGGEHHAFGSSLGRGKNRMDHHHPAIQQLTLKFWDAYLKNDAAALEWLQSDLPREDCALIERDVWEWK